jgi:hypothetical protein
MIETDLIVQTGSLGAFILYLGWEARRRSKKDDRIAEQTKRRDELAASREDKLIEVLSRTGENIGEQSATLRNLSHVVEQSAAVVAACSVNARSRLTSVEKLDD